VLRPVGRPVLRPVAIHSCGLTVQKSISRVAPLMRISSCHGWPGLPHHFAAYGIPAGSRLGGDGREPCREPATVVSSSSGQPTCHDPHSGLGDQCEITRWQSSGRAAPDRTCKAPRGRPAPQSSDSWPMAGLGFTPSHRLAGKCTQRNWLPPRDCTSVHAGSQRRPLTDCQRRPLTDCPFGPSGTRSPHSRGGHHIPCASGLAQSQGSPMGPMGHAMPWPVYGTLA
jgi:hypothetical protein